MEKIGILGGTFDQIHYGHLFIAHNAMHCFCLDRVIFIPSGTPPHKLLINISDKSHRYNMTQLAIKGNKRCEISDIEYSKDGVSYTVDTVAALKNSCPDAMLYYIVGADSLFAMSGWKNFRKLAKMIEIISINRMTSKFMDAAEAAASLEGKYNAKIHTLEMPILEISSTEIRRRVKNNLPIKYMLPESVEQYIKRNKLYK